MVFVGEPDSGPLAVNVLCHRPRRGNWCLISATSSTQVFARPPDQSVHLDGTGTGTRSFLMLRPFDLVSCFFTRRVLARLLSTFLCCLALVIKPWSQFGGPSAFLLLTLKELVFSAQDTLAQHLEATILNITGALVGIGLSTFARYIASLRPDYTASSRAIPAVFLVVIAFLGKQHSTSPSLPY